MATEINLQKFKTLLLERQQLLLKVKAQGEEAAQTVELDQSRVGRLSRMDALQAQAMLQESDRRRQQELSHISNALQRIDAGDYGFCLECGEKIAIQRLEYDPATQFCIVCATVLES